MFVLVDERNDNNKYSCNDKIMCGKLWFVRLREIIKIERETIEYWSFPRTFSVGDKAFIAFEKYCTSGSLTYIWGVVDGKPYQPNISGKGNGLTLNNGEIELTASDYDAIADDSMNFKTGHTLKKYYFYHDGTIFRVC